MVLNLVSESILTRLGLFPSDVITIFDLSAVRVGLFTLFKLLTRFYPSCVKPNLLKFKSYDSYIL